VARCGMTGPICIPNRPGGVRSWDDTKLQLDYSEYLRDTFRPCALDPDVGWMRRMGHAWDGNGDTRRATALTWPCRGAKKICLRGGDMRGVRGGGILGRRVIATVCGLAVALIAGTAASSAVFAVPSGGAHGQTLAAARPGQAFAISLARRGWSPGEVAPGAAVPYQIAIRLPAGSKYDVTIATVTDPVGIGVSAHCTKPSAKTQAASSTRILMCSPMRTPSALSGPADTGLPAPRTIPAMSSAYQPRAYQLPAQSGVPDGERWRPTCVVTASGNTVIRAVVHVPSSMARGAAMYIAVLGVAVPDTGTASGSGSTRRLLAVAYTLLRTLPANSDRHDPPGTSATPSADPTVATAQEYIASLTAALAKSPNGAALATALQNLATGFQQLAVALHASKSKSKSTSGGEAATLPPLATIPPVATTPALTPLPSGSQAPHTPTPFATTTLLPLIAPSFGGQALPTPSSSSSSGSSTLGQLRPVSSSTPGLNWPDVAAITVVAGAVLALLLLRSRRSSNRPDNRR
jgi:hypothetical protein